MNPLQNQQILSHYFAVIIYSNPCQILAKLTVYLEAVINAWQSAIAEMPCGPGRPTLHAQDLLGATYYGFDVVG